MPHGQGTRRYTPCIQLQLAPDLPAELALLENSWSTFHSRKAEEKLNAGDEERKEKKRGEQKEEEEDRKGRKRAERRRVFRFDEAVAKRVRSALQAALLGSSNLVDLIARYQSNEPTKKEVSSQQTHIRHKKR